MTPDEIMPPDSMLKILLSQGEPDWRRARG